MVSHISLEKFDSIRLHTFSLLLLKRVRQLPYLFPYRGLTTMRKW